MSSTERERIERFNLLVVNTDRAVESSLAVHPDGDWVKFTDYRRELAKREARVRRIVKREFAAPNKWKPKGKLAKHIRANVLLIERDILAALRGRKG